ncbi:DinB family protein [uncultured Paludibaculum sp.]|uniref:DinB family protein n=1 Tax=uncultured Paludibaculum sp. TaxID=1765020 RepID=UPI002AAAEE4E|nr:DinB family protein [uncultured Paludibaculum sp.]
MPFSHDEAKLIAGYTLANYERERNTTKTVIAAIPHGQEDYKPHPNSMPALRLAFHIVASEKFFLDGVIKGAFESGGDMPDSIKTPSDVLAWYDVNVPPAIDAVKALPAESISKTIDFYGMMKAQAMTYLSLMLGHSIHHRGQLSAYLRPMGAKVPSIYGPSGDSALGS